MSVMRLRARHLAGLLLLLAALGTAEASSPRAGSTPVPTHCIHMLLAQRTTQTRDAAPIDFEPREPLTTALAPDTSVPLAATHPMAASAAHSARLHAVTGSSL
ncbi:hypothetical protein SAMN05421819_0434 [Bryocella elongata]|uniref:Secreted protein n=1 Tax=Bryocella elongata TaxID=863522 RepID=A0A1H5T1E2_9BACT|nr:hypothetical protein [Bryocella elongata]SEF56554.1 hypothetical protein SAMN05421819_0434 [Bryocella elongata]